MAHLTGKAVIVYEETRSREFQTAKVSATIEVEIVEGETVAAAIAEWQPVLKHQITELTSNEVERLVREKRKREAEDPAPPAPRRY